MLPSKMNYLVMFLVIFFQSNQSFGIREGSHLIQKRMELESCIVRFDVHEDTIIRTEESRAIGAKFLDYADLGSREECLRLCCETEGCDVFVFEEKSQGTCFLFKCGPPENFRCKFTNHTNYSSAVLTPLRQVVPPPTQPTQIRVVNIGLSQHEMELKNLRDGKQIGREKTTTLIPPLGVRIMPMEKITTKPPFAAVQSSKCGRFEFPCHSGECIGVYNVCDGIPQCDDGSDEGPECPTTGASNTKPPANSNQVATHLDTFNSNASSSNNNISGSSSSSSNSNSNDATSYEKNPNSNLQTAYKNLNNEVDRIQQAQLQNGQLLTRNLMPPMILSPNTQISERKPVELQNNSPQSSLVYHEKLSRNREDPMSVPQWPGIHQQNSGQYYEPDSHIFNHKGGLQVSTNNLPSQYGPNSMYDSANYLPISRENSMSVQDSYRNMLSNQQGWLPDRFQQKMDWPPQQLLPQQMYDNTMPVNQQQQQQSVIGLLPPELPPKQQMMQQPTMLKPDWQIRPNPPLKSHDVIPQFPAPEKINKPANNAVKPDQQSSSGEESDDDNSDYELEDVKTTEAPKKKPKKHKTKAKAKTDQDDGEIATISVKEVKSHAATKSSERVDHPIHEQLKLIKTDLEIEFADHDGPAERPGGAVLSLTLGVIITATLAVLVGCRMRAVGRRIRRTGKSSYAHEADFLVNGMYL